ncbi:MAG: hypothetical protein E7220_05680, partial [Clostridiales bacterium]|nr:hypothetical protein [Clostridiales bacterium]
GADAPQDTRQYEPGEKATVSFTPVPSRANYDFLGWTTYSNTSSVLPGGANEGKYYADSTIEGVKTIDGYTYHYGEEGGSNTQKELQIEMRNDVKFYAVWVAKTYYTVDFYGNSTSNGGAPNKVTVKDNRFTGPDNRTYTKSASNDGFRTDEAIFRSTSPYKGDKSTKIKLPDGSQMFNNENSGAKFMGWSKNTDAKLADHVAGEDLEDITMDENVVLNAVWAYPVRNVTLEDIEKPVYQNAPSEDVEATAASGVSVTKSTWSPSTDQFAAGTPYKLTVKMKASDGFYFDKNELPAVKMNVATSAGVDEVDVDSNNVTLNTEGSVLTATYTFDPTENIIVNGEKDNNKNKPIAFTGVTAPEAGKKLMTAGSAGDSRVDNDSWFPAVAWTATDAEGNAKEVKPNAEPDTIYTATLRIKPAKGYEFNADVTKVTFSGDEVLFSTDETVTTKARVDAETGDLIVSYTFPKTAAVDNVIKVKLNGALRNNQTLPPQTITTAEIVDEDSKVANADWFIVKNEELVPVSAETTKVTPSTTYVAQVTLKPADGYRFEAGSTVVNFSGKEMTVQGKDEETTGNSWAKMAENGSIRVSHEFTSSGDEDTTITLKLSGLLRNGQNLPDQTFTSDDSVYKDSRAEHITWYKVGKDGSLTEVDPEKTRVAPSTTYVAQVTLRPATGYTFEAGSTKINFGGETLIAISKGATPEGNNWAQITENDFVKVSHEFTSSADTLIEIVDPASVNAEYGTKVSEVKDLPREVQIVTENGKSNTDVTWVSDGKVVVVTGDGTEEATDAAALKSKREAHTVTILGTVTIPEGTTVPKGMKTTAKLSIKVNADPRIALEEEADKVIANAGDAVTAAKAADIEEPKELIKAVNDAKDDLSTYKGNLDESTPEGLTKKTKDLQDAIDALNSYISNNDPIELSLWGIKKSKGTLDYNAKFPDEVNTTDETVLYQDRRQEADWQTEDQYVISGRNYVTEVTLRPSKGATFNLGRHIIFDDVTIAVTAEKPEKTAENEAVYAYAVLNEDESITVGRTYQSKNANMTKADAIDPVEVAWDAAKTPEGLGLPSEDGIDIDDKNRNNARETATIADNDWNLDNFVSKDTENREGNEVTVSAVLTMPAGVNDPDTETKTVTVTVKIAADPRLETEAAAKALDEKAKALIEEAQGLEVGEDEIANLQSDLDAMNAQAAIPEADKGNPDRVQDLQDKIDAVDPNLNALQKIVDDKKAANAVTDKVNDLPAPSDIRPEDKAAIEDARKAYDALTDEQKAVAGDEVKDKLEAAENALAKAIADKKAADDEAARKEEEARKAEETRKAEEARKAAEEAKANTVNDSVGIRPGSNVSAVDKYLAGRQNDSDPKGSKVAPIKLRSDKQTTRTITLNYKKVRGAAKYVIYGNECGKTKKLKKLKTTKKNKIVIRKISRKLKKGRYHKFLIVAVDENNKVISTSKVVHVATKGGKVCNYRTVRTQAAKNNYEITLEKGKTFELKAKAIPQSAKLTVKKHRGIIYESSNTSVAKVTKKGVIRAVGTGTCKIYAYAQDGRYRSTIVTVK